MALEGAYDDQSHHMVCIFTGTPAVWVDFRHLRITYTNPSGNSCYKYIVKLKAV